MRVERLFIGATITWALALPLATFLASRADPSRVMSVVALAVYGAGSVVCHQLPDRTFHVWSAQMPVCARCAGIYAGAAIAAAALMVGRAARTGAAVRFPPDVLRPGLLIAALPTLATVVFEWSSGHTPSNGVRALAGIPLGFAVAWAIGSALAAPVK
jgi:uncharacterized membrane protein